MPTTVERILNVTDLSQYVFCPRQFYLAKVLGLHRQPPEFVEGALEHDARRLLNESLCRAYSGSERDAGTLMSAARGIIDKVLDYAKSIALLQHPAFSKQIDEFVRELSFRFQLEEWDRTKLLGSDATDSSWHERIRMVFPTKNEYSVFSQRLGLRGRIDEVYERKDGSLAVRDIKTAYTCFPFDEANKVQLGAYVMLLEDQESRAIVSASVFSSRSLAVREVRIDDELKKQVLDTAENVRMFLANPTQPEVLSGDAAVKCRACFLREECVKLGHSGQDSKGIEALFSSHGKLSLFGGD